ncbi:hypothetical protein ALC60_03259 [Trachymyrmex zeteki]|uniref:Uncharacterized protein n=1 Tax=Mycetomoellerius zeteki TaxID=64791 RepID=A0A151XBL4_9HYME|nr:hypothetical protein ALC60_03259 [Trachymyrmex zeteki]
MTNRETMPGATGKIPKNADNKNESSRASPPSPVYPALVVGARWRRCRHQPTRAAWGIDGVVVVVVAVAAAVTVVVVGDGQNTSAYPFGSNFREESQSDKASRRVASVAAGREKYRG